MALWRHLRRSLARSRFSGTVMLAAMARRTSLFRRGKHPMSTPRSTTAVSRRSAIAGLGAGGLGVAMAARQAAAQEASLAGHPNVGVWMVTSPIGPAIAVYADDGSVITALTPTAAGPQGVSYPSTQVGTWESTGERGT